MKASTLQHRAEARTATASSFSLPFFSTKMGYKNEKSYIFVLSVQGRRSLEGAGRVKPLEATGTLKA